MSKSSPSAFKVFLDGTNGDLPEEQQIEFFGSYMNDFEKKQAVDTALEFKSRFGKDADLRAETDKAEWPNKILSLFFVVALSGLLLLQTSNPERGADLVTMGTEHTSPPLFLPDNNATGQSAIEMRIEEENPKPENKVKDRTIDFSIDKISFYNKNIEIYDNAGIVGTQKTILKQSGRLIDISLNNHCNLNKAIISDNSSGQSGLHPLIFIDIKKDLMVVSEINKKPQNTAGISDSRPEIEYSAPDPYVIRLLLNSFR